MQKRASMKLTDNLLPRLPTPERGNKITWDDALKGFGGRVRRPSDSNAISTTAVTAR